MSETEVVTDDSKALARIDPVNAVTVFTKGGLNAVLDDIERAVRKEMPALDVSTEDGRKGIKSLSYRIARSKNSIDEEGRKLTEEWRKQTALVNAERKKSFTRLEALQDEVRQPLTEFEEKERSRVAAHEAALAELGGLVDMLRQYPDLSVADLEQHLIDFTSIPMRDWEEFVGRAQTARRETMGFVIDRIERRKRYEAEQAELARLRAESDAARLRQAEQDQRERDARLQAEAAEVARLEAERVANAAAQEEHTRVVLAAGAERRRVQEEADRVHLEHQRQQREAEARRLSDLAVVEGERLAAERRAKEAEDARVAQEAKAKRERDSAAKKLREAQEQAARDAEAAARRERDRIAAEQKRVDDERKAREADEAHTKKIRDELVADIFASIAGVDATIESAEKLADALFAGEIRHVRVEF